MNRHKNPSIIQAPTSSFYCPRKFYHRMINNEDKINNFTTFNFISYRYHKSVIFNKVNLLKIKYIIAR